MIDLQAATALPAVTHREDYRPPDWMVPDLHLDFDLAAASTKVRATLSVKRNGRHDRAHKLIDDLPLFSAAPKPAPAQKESAVEAELKKINPDDLSPKEALELLYRLRGLGTKD